MGDPRAERPVALVTGASRGVGIGAAIARLLAVDGWDVGVAFWRPYDETMTWGSDGSETDTLLGELRDAGAATVAIEADLASVASAGEVVDRVRDELGPIRALVLNHAEDAAAGLFDATVDQFDRAMAVNARAAWLLIRAFAEQFEGPYGTGRIVAMTSDATVSSLAYGASKAALDRIVVAAATELSDRGITANAVDPGPTATGWIDEELAEQLRSETLVHRLGGPQDAANLVAFLCSERGGWVNGQLLRSDGGRPHP